MYLAQMLSKHCPDTELESDLIGRLRQLEAISDKVEQQDAALEDAKHGLVEAVGIMMEAGLKIEDLKAQAAKLEAEKLQAEAESEKLEEYYKGRMESYARDRQQLVEDLHEKNRSYLFKPTGGDVEMDALKITTEVFETLLDAEDTQQSRRVLDYLQAKFGNYNNGPRVVFQNH